jgi:drug/metabolite transporter (DMT)-like permease
VAVIVGWRPIPLDGVGLLSVCASLVAACSYGAASVYGKIAFKGLNPLAIAIGQLFLASALVLPLAALNPPMQTPTPSVLLAVIGLAVLSTALAYLLYFDLIANAGPTAAASVTFLVPFFSILWGSLFLGETIEPEQIVGFGIILIGLVLVLGLRLRTPAPASTQAV